MASGDPPPTIVLDEQYKKDVIEWAKAVKTELRLNVERLTQSHQLRDSGQLSLFSLLRKTTNRITGETRRMERIPLHESIGYKIWKKYGDIDNISFPFERHGIYTHLGVGKGHKITNPRKKTDWFNPVLKHNMEVLSYIVSNYYADKSINTLTGLLETQDEILKRKY